MKSDWKLDDTTWDLVIDNTTNWDLKLLTGIDYYKQKVRIKLQFFLGEWFLDTEKGVDWYGTILVKNPNLTNVDNLLKVTVLESPGVIELLQWQSSFNIQNRTYTVIFEANTDAGELNFNEGIPL